MAVHIQQAASEVFYGFSREEELTNFNTGVFLGLPWLDYLDVSFNFISNVTSGVFSGLPALATLDMGYNSLTTVPPLDLRNLTSLQLPWNPIPHFLNTSFVGVPRLTYLDVNNCGLSSVSFGAFAPLTELTSLSLNNNMLTGLPADG